MTQDEWRELQKRLPTLMSEKAWRKLHALRKELKTYKKLVADMLEEERLVVKYKNMAIEAVNEARRQELDAQTWKQKYQDLEASRNPTPVVFRSEK